MSFPTRRFKPKISRVRSSHSSVSQPVKIMRCPPVSEASSVVLEDSEIKMPRPLAYKPRRSVGTKKPPKKMSPPKTKPSKSVIAAQNIPISDKNAPNTLTDDFLEEMKAGLDEMGEKLKNVEKELTRKKTLVKPPDIKSKTNLAKKKEAAATYNPIEFTDMDFDVAGSLEMDNSYEGGVVEEPNARNLNPDGVREVNRTAFVPSNEAVESVIAKIRNDIQNWRISKGMEISDGDTLQEPSVTSNGRGEIVVREEAERETPYESNRPGNGPAGNCDDDDDLSFCPPKDEQPTVSVEMNSSQATVCVEVNSQASNSDYGGVVDEEEKNTYASLQSSSHLDYPRKLPLRRYTRNRFAGKAARLKMLHQRTKMSHDRLEVVRRIPSPSAPARDEFDDFFSSMASSARKLPRDLQISVKREIANIIFSAETQAMCDESG